jgi:hypothetical protein
MALMALETDEEEKQDSLLQDLDEGPLPPHVAAQVPWEKGHEPPEDNVIRGGKFFRKGRESSQT